MAAPRQHAGPGARARLALLCALAALAPPRAVTQYCPYLENPVEVYSAEDGQVNMQQAWISSPSTAPERKHIAGRLWHGDCPGTAGICGSCRGNEIPKDGRYIDGSDHIRVEYSVLFGRLFLAEGYLSCNPILNSATFDVMSKSEEQSFVFVDYYEVVNCSLQYLTFQGMRYSNKMKQLNEFGIQPRVRIRVSPPRAGGPSADGIDFDYGIESTTLIVMDEINTLPNLVDCPTMGIESQRGTARYPEQYDRAVVASAERQHLLYWDPSSGGNRCLQTRVPRADRFLFPAPQPNGYQKPRMIGGAPVGLYTAVTGDPVAPMRIQPKFCQTEDVRILDPPFCQALADAGHTACAADPTSYVYHIEDYEDAVLKVNGVRLWDKDIWTGHIDTTFSFKFRTESAGIRKANDPFDHQVDDGGLQIQDGSGIFGFYCPRPYYDSKKRASQFETGLDSKNQAWNKYCAKTIEDAMSEVIILNKQQTKLYVVPSTDRTPITAFQKTNCRMTRCDPLEGCDPLAEKDLPENKWQCSQVSDMIGKTDCMWGFGPRKNVCERKEVTTGNPELSREFRCICKSKVYQTSVHQSQTTWSMVLFWEVADRDNRSKVFETGYLDITYTNQSIVDGTMWADPQILDYYAAYNGGAGPFDWFRVSPLKLMKGVVSTNTDVTTFTVDASTKLIHNPRFQVTLETKYGNLSLPNMKNLALVTPANISRTRIFFEGTIDQVNEAVDVIEYRVPGPVYPHFHTLSPQHSIYGRVEERLTLTIDDLGNAGRPSKWGTVTSMEFNLVVVADNDGPEVSGPASYHHKENEWFALSGLSVVDVDAKDRLRPNETLVGPGRIHIIDLQLLFVSGFGKFRFDTNATRRLHLKTPVPGSLRPVPGEPEPCVAQCGQAMVLATYEQFLSINSKLCRDCLEDYAKSRVATDGNRVVLFEGDLDDCNFALGRTFYKGDPGFNTKSPARDPFTDLGKETPSFGDPKAQEKVSITAMDNGNAGCTSNQSKQNVLEASVRLDPVEDFPSLLFYQDGMDMCERCKDAGTCIIYCPGGSPTVYLFESTSLTFNQSFSVQIRDFDHRDTDFRPAVYKLNLKVAQGTLLLPATTIVNEQSEAITGLSFSIGSQGCVDCKEFEISGSMYELNKVLMGITYTPIKFYNSRFGSPEYLIVSVTQMAPVKLAQSTLSVELFAQEVNDKPELNLYVDPKKGTQLPISGEFHDFILLGGSIDRSKYCGGDTSSCFLMRDVDSCESMYNAKGTKPAAADTVAVIQGTAPGCLDTSMSVGRIRMVAKCNHGNLWFFTFSEIRQWESKGNQWPPDLTLVPAQDPGKSQRLLITNHHLSQYAGGILRYYASTDSARPDTITLEFDDQGNTGRERPGEPMFCCCGNKACDKCVPAAGGGMGGNGCRYELEVSSCTKVPGWTCADADLGSKGIPGWAVTVIICIASALAVGGVAKIVYHGSATNPLKLLLREEANEVSQAEEKTKMSLAKFVQDSSMKDQVSLAVAV